MLSCFRGRPQDSWVLVNSLRTCKASNAHSPLAAYTHQTQNSEPLRTTAQGAAFRLPFVKYLLEPFLGDFATVNHRANVTSRGSYVAGCVCAGMPQICESSTHVNIPTSTPSTPMNFVPSYKSLNSFRPLTKSTDRTSYGGRRSIARFAGLPVEMGVCAGEVARPQVHALLTQRGIILRRNLPTKKRQLLCLRALSVVRQLKLRSFER